MATYVLIPGAGSDPWHWHRVVPLLEARGHDVVTPDLPCTDDGAGFEEYAAAVVDAIGDRRDLVVVAQSMGGFTAALVCEQRPVDLLVYVAAMVPRPGETGGAWWANTGYEAGRREQEARTGIPAVSDDDVAIFLHDVPPDVIAAGEEHVHAQSGTPFERPYPLRAMPSVPTRFVLCTEDRFFPAPFLRRVVRERLGIEPDELPSGHCPALARPDALVELLEEIRSRPSD